MIDMTLLRPEGSFSLIFDLGESSDCILAVFLLVLDAQAQREIKL
jgi:hypothetical protein